MLSDFIYKNGQKRKKKVPVNSYVKFWHLSMFLWSMRAAYFKGKGTRKTQIIHPAFRFWPFNHCNFTKHEHRAYLAGGFVWDLMPALILLHSVSAQRWCTPHRPQGGSALLLHWPLWVWLPLCVAAYGMTAERGTQTRLQICFLTPWQLQTHKLRGYPVYQVPVKATEKVKLTW